MVKSCTICYSKNKSLFCVPREKTKQKLWTEALKKPLKKGTFICEEHFTPNDIVWGTGKVNFKRLKPNAVPIKLSDKSAVQIKVEPDLELLVGEDAPELAEPTIIKIEVNNPDAFDPIPDEQVDAHNQNAKDANKGKGQRLNCGRIDMLLENDHFILNCTYCDIEYEIFENFIQHIKQQHEKDIRPYKPPDAEEEESLKKVTGDSFNDNVVDVQLKNESEKNSDSNNIDDDNEIDDLDYSLDDADEDYEPTTKKQKLSNDETLQILPKTKKHTEMDKAITKKDNEKLITFDTKPQKYVITFLDLIKANAILWHRRQSILKRFDDTLNKVLTEFNKKCPKYHLTEEEARMSINRIKDLYYRVTDPNHKRHLKNSTHKAKFPEFFQHCSAIEVNSKKIVYSCDKCLAFFFIETDLQIHKFKRHRIGELPFKCSRCNYGFTNAEKRDEHEAKHNRLISHICEICNRGFFSADKLQAHATVHTNDSKPVCEICGQMFQTYNRYRRHKIHHEPPKEKCNICGKLYYEKWNLSEHVKSHLNERQYSCDVCGKSYNHQNDVTIHKRVVHNIKPQPRRLMWVNKIHMGTAEDADKNSKNQDIDSESENDVSSCYENKEELSQGVEQ